MQESLEGLEAALYLALVVLDRVDLSARFRAILVNAAATCRSDADGEPAEDEDREALRAFACAMERAARLRPFELIDGGKAD